MNKEKCKHEEWNPCGNNFYSCRQCGILRTSQQVNIYAEKDKQISKLEQQLAEKEQTIEEYKKHIRFKGREITKLKQANQDKIEFTIAELKRPRDWCVAMNENNKSNGFQKEPNLENLATLIDQQIKELKEK